MTEGLKRLAIHLLPPFFLNRFRAFYRGKFAAKDHLDRQMLKYLDYEGGFFVELGANNGITQSNTYYFEKQKKWKGVLIEPSPNKFFECRGNRSDANAFFCCACVSFDYKEEFVKMAYSDLMSVPMNLESDLSDPMGHVQKGAEYLAPNELIFEYGAKAVPLNHLLETANAPRLIDFLSLDVEGAELEVLKGIDHSRYRFQYLLIECRDFEKLNAYLSSAGYRFLEKLSHHDYLFH